MANKGVVERAWYVIDAKDLVLGRLATQVASMLRGKHKPIFTPHVDTGDNIIIINAEKIRLTGKKLDKKLYYRHSGYPGGIKSTTARTMLDKHPTFVIREAVRGMLPRGPLGYAMIKKLHVYAGSEHPHAAQQPIPFEVVEGRRPEHV
ncbi:MAG: 50S ribosomal protein L13 [Clostridia bacterium]|nr:50S ribosomal protein L13 [Clostridia bacterium]